MITNEQITALAREYGEYVANNPIVASYLDTDEKKDINIRANARRAKDVIKWMTDRYCLVEKSKAADLCRLTLEHSDSVDYGLIDGLTDIVCEIFHEIYHQVADNPDFGKEVE